MSRRGFIHKLMASWLCCLFACLAQMSWAAESPINDRFTNSIVIVGTNAVVSGNISYATRETGEPAIPGATVGHSVWWSWTAPTNGQLVLSITQSNFGTAMAVFAGDSLDGLQLISSNSTRWSAWWGSEDRTRDRLTTDVRAGTTYRIAADWNRYVAAVPLQPVTNAAANVSPEAGAPAEFALSFIPAPANDKFESPTVIEGNKWTVSDASTLGAIVEPGESSGANHTVWWSWTAPRSGLATVSYEAIAEKASPKAETQLLAWPEPTYDDPSGWPSNAVMMLRVPVPPVDLGSLSSWSFGVINWDIPWSGGSYWNGVTYVGLGSFRDSGFGGGYYINSSLSELNPLPGFFPAISIYQGNSMSDLASLGTITSSGVTTFQAVQGETYRFRLGSTTATPGSASFNFLLTAPENDDFTNRIALAGVEATASGHTVGATVEAGEPPTSGSGRTTWWTWTPPATGNATLTLGSSAFTMAVFKGDQLERLKPVASSSNLIKLTTVAGEALQIAIDGATGTSEGDFSFSIKLEPPPPTINSQLSHRLEDGSFLVQAERLRGRKITIRASWDLVYWQDLWTGVVNADSVSFQDFGPIGWSTQFYSVSLAQ